MYGLYTRRRTTSIPIFLYRSHVRRSIDSRRVDVGVNFIIPRRKKRYEEFFLSRTRNVSRQKDGKTTTDHMPTKCIIIVINIFRSLRAYIVSHR